MPVPVARRLRFVSVTAGAGHTCGLTAAGSAYCWGRNNSGELGDGTVTDRTAPVPVVGNLTIAHLAAGSGHTCALSTDGQAWCWGGNANGQLGDGTVGSRSVPVPVAGDLRFSSLAGGGSHTCGVTTGGAAYCWGSNTWGELGDSSTTQRLTPVLVAGRLSFASLSAGTYFTCGVPPDGKAYCWGLNSSSRLGDGRGCDPRYPYYPCSEVYRSSPGDVAGALAFAALDAGSDHACGVTTALRAYCWGGNTLHELGTGQSSMYEAVPRAVASGDLAFTQITSSVSHSCAISPEGKAYCWGGPGFDVPVLGSGPPGSSSSVPVPVVMPSRAR